MVRVSVNAKTDVLISVIRAKNKSPAPTPWSWWRRNGQFWLVAAPPAEKSRRRSAAWAMKFYNFAYLFQKFFRKELLL